MTAPLEGAATQDPRLEAVEEYIRLQFGVDPSEARMAALAILGEADAQDAAAGIRRVPAAAELPNDQLTVGEIVAIARAGVNDSAGMRGALPNRRSPSGSPHGSV